MRLIGRYEILEELGRGSMGAVYKARDPEIGRVVAIKIILTANLSAQQLEGYKQRFRAEAQAAGRMSHPGIITIYDIAEDEAGQPYLVMEFVEGTALEKRLGPGAERLPVEQTLSLAIQVALALDYAHRQGVVHRDIKPANILVTPDGRTKITDFGIAKLSGTHLTQAGQLLGTPAFMSPEQFSGAAVDARSDIFSLGATLYWMCTGEKPFAGDTVTAVSFKIVYTAPIPARQLNASLPTDLDLVLLRCLAKNSNDRYATASAVAADLKAIREGRPVAAKPMPGASLGDTVIGPALPVPGPAAGTIPTSVPPAQPAAAPAATIPLAAPSPSGRRRGRWAAVALATLALAAGGYWWKSAGRAGAPAAASVVAPSRPNVVGRGLVGSRLAASATLRVICEHNFRSASLEIFSDGEPLLDTSLHGERQDFGVVHVFKGRTVTSAPITAGRHVLSVRISSREQDYEDQAEISGYFAENSTHTLLVDFGKGSGIGLTGRKLGLSWR